MADRSGVGRGVGPGSATSGGKGRGKGSRGRRPPPNARPMSPEHELAALLKRTEVLTSGSSYCRQLCLTCIRDKAKISGHVLEELYLFLKDKLRKHPQVDLSSPQEYSQIRSFIDERLTGSQSGQLIPLVLDWLVHEAESTMVQARVSKLVEGGNEGGAVPGLNDWEEYMSEEYGAPYFYNKKTGSSQWEVPLLYSNHNGLSRVVTHLKSKFTDAAYYTSDW